MHLSVQALHEIEGRRAGVMTLSSEQSRDPTVRFRHEVVYDHQGLRLWVEKRCVQLTTGLPRTPSVQQSFPCTEVKCLGVADLLIPTGFGFLLLFIGISVTITHSVLLMS